LVEKNILKVGFRGGMNKVQREMNFAVPKDIIDVVCCSIFATIILLRRSEDGI